MARNGSGTFNRVYDWTDDAANGENISASRMDTEMDGFATALTDSIAKDGQTTPTANLPMGGFRHTGVGDASARTHYGKVSQIQDGAYTYAGTGGGTVDVITLSLTPAITAYATGQKFSFKSSGANTGAVTVNFNSIGAKAITKRGTAPLVSGDIASGAIINITYDGTQFQLDSVSSGEDAQIVLATQVFG